MRRQQPNRSRRTGAQRLSVVAVVSVAAAVVAACGSGAGSPGSTTGPSASATAVVTPPDVTLQGCTYVLDGKVPNGEPPGVKPSFPPFSPDQSAAAALGEIKARGGKAMVDSVTLTSGTDLYAGPDTGGTKVGTVPSGRSILAAEPVVWTDATGGTWLAFFLSCGGDSLYWVSVGQADRQGSTVGGSIAAQIAQLQGAAPYTQTGQASLLPIVVSAHGQLVFGDPRMTFSVGRGELIGTE